MTAAVERTASTMTHQGFLLWFTGLSGSGKSTISVPVAKALKKAGCKVEVLDGDIVRMNLSKGLGFSKEDRDINVRRIGFVGGMLSRNGVIALTAAISPYRETRESIRDQTVNFIEVFVDCPVEVCAQRDVKGLYEKAYKGEIANFTGVSDPYEPPANPEIVLNTHEESIEDSVNKVMTYLLENDYISQMP